jgi:membrane associated rhomboid family serine protease
MLEQVHSLDLLYERETTSKLLEFKLKYLVSYATLMSNYFVHMNIEDIVTELVSLQDPRGRQLILFAA